MRKVLWLTAAFGLSLAVSSCQVVQVAALGYGGYKAYGTYVKVKEVKTIQDSTLAAKPVFLGYQSAMVEARMMPREEGKAKQVAVAFKDSLGYALEQNAALLGNNPVKVCTTGSCQGKTLVIRFEEEGYNANLAEKITLGSELKGKVLFVDLEKGDVLAEAPLRVAQNYADLIQQFNLYVGMAVVKSESEKIRANDPEHLEERTKELSKKQGAINPIKPGYQDLLEGT